MEILEALWGFPKGGIPADRGKNQRRQFGATHDPNAPKKVAFGREILLVQGTDRLVSEIFEFG